MKGLPVNDTNQNGDNPGGQEGQPAQKGPIIPKSANEALRQSAYREAVFCLEQALQASERVSDHEQAARTAIGIRLDLYRALLERGLARVRIEQTQRQLVHAFVEMEWDEHHVVRHALSELHQHHRISAP